MVVALIALGIAALVAVVVLGVVITREARDCRQCPRCGAAWSSMVDAEGYVIAHCKECSKVQRFYLVDPRPYD